MDTNEELRTLRLAYDCQRALLNRRDESIAALLQQRDDLLAALVDAVALIESIDGRDNSCDPITDISDLRAAIARAQGE